MLILQILLSVMGAGAIIITIITEIAFHQYKKIVAKSGLSKDDYLFHVVDFSKDNNNKNGRVLSGTININGTILKVVAIRK